VSNILPQIMYVSFKNRFQEHVCVLDFSDFITRI